MSLPFARPPHQPGSRVRAQFALLASVALGLALPAPSAGQYVPERGDWEMRPPEQVGMDPAGVRAAVEYALAHETSVERDQELSQAQSFGREPFGGGIGPFKVRAGPAGLIVRNGYIVAEWGDTHRVDMTHSVTKSFLSTVVGLAWEDGLIRSLDDTVREYMAPVDVPEGDGEPGVDRTGFGRPDPTTMFESPHNRMITWDHLLRQTSDWEGTLWGKPDWADRPDRDPSTWLGRARHAPGTVFEYNDTRVNILALAATRWWPPACGGAGCQRSCTSGSWDPSGLHRPGAGMGTTTRGSRWTVDACNR